MLEGGSTKRAAYYCSFGKTFKRTTSGKSLCKRLPILQIKRLTIALLGDFFSDGSLSTRCSTKRAAHCSFRRVL